MDPGEKPSKNIHHQTPDYALTPVIRVFGQIDQDPAAGYSLNVPAKKRLRTRGLTATWSGRVFVNPPYGRQIVHWIERCYHMGGVPGVDVIALIPARVDTRWWRDYVGKATAVCFWKSRIKFIGQSHGAKFPSAFVYYGRTYARQFCKVFSEYGQIWRCLEPQAYRLLGKGRSAGGDPDPRQGVLELVHDNEG